MTKKPLAGIVLVFLMVLTTLLVACGDATNTPGAAATAAGTGATTAAGGTTAAMTSAAATTAAMTSAVATTSAAATTSASATTAAMTSAAAMTTSASATTAAAATTVAGAATGATSCTSNSGPKGKVVVASKDFPESIIVANIYADALQDAGIPVDRKMNLGAVAIVQAALCKGDISLYPEYTGTGLGVVLKQTAKSNDPKVVYQQVADAYKSQYGLIWLDPAPYNNTNGIAVTKEVAQQYNLKKLSDLPAVAKNLRFASNPEFIGDRSDIDGLGSVKKTYGTFDFKETKQVDIKLRYKALLDKQAEACVAFGTDGEISGYGLVLLEDDKNNFPPYQTSPVVRSDILAAYPNIQTVLNKVSAKLTNDKVSGLNWKVVGPDKQDAQDVAAAFAKAEGLTK